jgi:hypothetical protein
MLGGGTLGGGRLGGGMLEGGTLGGGRLGGATLGGGSGAAGVVDGGGAGIGRAPEGSSGTGGATLSVPDSSGRGGAGMPLDGGIPPGGGGIPFGGGGMPFEGELIGGGSIPPGGGAPRGSTHCPRSQMRSPLQSVSLVHAAWATVGASATADARREPSSAARDGEAGDLTASRRTVRRRGAAPNGCLARRGAIASFRAPGSSTGRGPR